MKYQIFDFKFLVVIIVGLMLYTCTDKKQKASPEVVIRISVKNEITVNGDTVSIDSLESKFEDIGATYQSNIKILPDPEAGAATVEKVQRRTRVYKESRK